MPIQGEYRGLDDHVPMKTVDTYEGGMDWTVFITTALGGLVRHGLTAGGGALASAGWIDASDTQALVGAGMVIAGLVWSVLQKKGPALLHAIASKVGL